MTPPLPDRAASTEPAVDGSRRPAGDRPHPADGHPSPTDEQPRRTSAGPILLCLTLMLLCPGLLLLVGTLQPYRSQLVLVAGCLLSLALLAAALHVGRGWLAARRASRPLDAAPVLCLLLGAATMLGLSQVIGEAYGVQGSALPRILHGVRHGVPLGLDLLYLAFVASRCWPWAPCC